ncbi:hypothetical protein, partial [Sphingomonas colocasiae]
LRRPAPQKQVSSHSAPFGPRHSVCTPHLHVLSPVAFMGSQPKNTWTGRIASDLGYTVVDGPFDGYGCTKFVFLKPKED